MDVSLSGGRQSGEDRGFYPEPDAPSERSQNPLSGSGLNRMMMESLAFGATERSLTLAKQAIKFPTTTPLTWPIAETAYLIPIFNGGCPWPLEFLAALGAGMPLVNL